LLILVVDDLEKKHPAELGDALGVAIDAGVLAHNVLDRLDCVANRHGLCDLLIESGLKFVDGVDEIRARAEWTNELDGRAHSIERRYLKDTRIAEVEDALVLIFDEESFQDGARLWAVPGEDVALAHILHALMAGESRLVKSDVADQVERIEVLADFFRERRKREALGFEFFNDGLLALG
jgi:hypothetical protein